MYAEGEGLKSALAILVDGISSFCSQHAESPCITELENIKTFIDQVQSWFGKLPMQRIRDTSYPILQQLDTLFRTHSQDTPIFLLEAAVQMGPQINISNDQMAVFVTIPSDMGRLWNKESLKQSLQIQNIAKGIIDDELEQLFARRQFNKRVCVARGKDPVPGDNAKLLWNIPIAKQALTPQTNHRTERSRLFEPIVKGQPIVQKTPATLGDAGWDVKGNEIPSIPGIDVPLPDLDNCAADPSGLALHATVNGCAFMEQGKLRIEETLIIPENVDSQTGNVKSNTSVTIKGDVGSDCQVLSNGHIAVGGTIDASIMKCTGSLFCNGGINGREKAKIEVKYNLSSHYINSATLIVGNEVYTNGSIIQSNISARRIKATGTKGQIIGGTLQAWDDVCAYEIGSDAKVRTTIILGEERHSLQDTEDKVAQAIKAREQQILTLKERMQKIAPICKKPNADEKIKKEFALYQNKIKTLSDEIDKLESKKEKVDRDLSRSEVSAKMVRAQNAIYPGTTIKIRGKSITIREKLGPSVIMYSDEKLITVPYQERPDEMEDEG